MLAPAEGLLASLAALFASLTMSLISVVDKGGGWKRNRDTLTYAQTFKRDGDGVRSLSMIRGRGVGQLIGQG